MLATCIPRGQGRPRARKFSTVDVLVKVIISAPSAASRARASVRSLRLRDRSVGKSNVKYGAQG
jgi:hypothetical protein